MGNAYIDLLTYLAGPAILGLVAWVWALWNSLNNFKIEVTREYIKSKELEEVKKDLRHISAILYMMAGKLGIQL